MNQLPYIDEIRDVSSVLKMYTKPFYSSPPLETGIAASEIIAR